MKRDVITIACVAFLIAVAFFFKEEDVRSKVVFLKNAMRCIDSFLQKSASANGGRLPIDFPESIQSDGAVTTTEIVLAEPFDDKYRSGVNRLKCKVRLPPLNGAVNDFSFRGAELKYLRLADKHAIVYSYGPDRDDDLGQVKRSDLLDWTTKDAPQIDHYAWDPSNGTHSSGDIYRIVSIRWQ